MPSQPRSDKPGWRGRTDGGPRGAPVAGKKAPGWMGEKKADPHKSAVRRRNLRLTAYVVVLLALIGAWIWYIIPTPQQTPLLTFAATDYDWPVPPNAWAAEDVDRFSDMVKDKVLTRINLERGPKKEWLNNLGKKLQRTPGGPGNDLLIVYLSMHGIVDGNNRPCLLLPGAKPSAPQQWLPVSELLETLGKRKGVKKLLILDANRIDANWNLGVLYNGFAEGLPRAVAEAGDPDLMVLNSCSPGQIGWAAPELSGSVFGYFLWRGLKGEADAFGNANRDDEVSLKELIAYLKAKVGRWTAGYRADAQVPMLLPEQSDHRLVFVEESEIPDPDSTSISWSAVGTLWGKHERLRKAYAYRLDPLKWEKFQHGLLYLEQLTTAGGEYKTRRNEWNDGLTKWAKELEETAEGDVAARSLPLDRRFRVADAAGVDVAAAREQLDARLNSKEEPAAGTENAGGDPPAETGPAEEPTAEAAPREPAPPKPSEPAESAAAPEDRTGALPLPANSEDAPPPDYLDAAEAAWNWARGEYEDGRETDDTLLPLQRNRLDEALRFVDESNAGNKPELIEMRMLRMLDAHLDRDTWQQNASEVRRALQLRNKAEDAAAPEDERTHYWIRPAVDAADERRRAAEDLLFVGNEPPDPQNETYSAAIENAEKLAAALQTRDEAWARIPYLAQWLCGRLRERGSAAEEAALRGQLVELIGENRRLADALELSAEDGGPAAADAVRAVVETKLGVLEKAYRDECDNLAQEIGAHPSGRRRIAGVLAVPLVPGDTRRILLDKLSSKVPAGGATAAAAGGPDEDDQPAEDSSQPPSRLAVWPDALTILESVDAAGASREKVLSKQLAKWLAVRGWQVRRRLYGDNGQPAPAGVRAPKSVYAEIEELLKETRNELTGATEAAEKGGNSAVKTRASCSRADQVVRTSAALLEHDRWGDAPDPTHQLRNLDLHYLMLWHARRAMEDFWGAEPGGGEPFFAAAADDYLASAEKLVDRVARPPVKRRSTEPARPKSTTPDAAKNRLAGLRKAAQKLLTPVELQRLLADEQGATLPHAMAVKLNDEGVALGDALPQGEAAYYLEQPQSGLPIDVTLRDGTGLRRTAVAIADDCRGPRPYEYEIANSEHFRALIGKEEPDGRGPLAMTARVYYRGHVAEHPCRFAAEALHVKYKPEDSGSTVRVSAGEQDASVVFVFDSSGSMQDPVDVTELGTKMNGARSTLSAMLGRLATFEKPPRVGLIVYGHRNGWNKALFKANGKLVPQHEAPPLSSDVEWVMAPQPLTQARKDQMIAKLAKLKPNGITPLYLSIIKAIKENRVAGETRHVIAITDGLNNQKGHDTDPVKIKINNVDADVHQSLQNVLAVVGDNRNGGNRLDVVGFALDKARLTPEERQKRKQQLSYLEKSLTNHPRCGFHNAGVTAELQEKLEELLGLWSYEVRQRGGPFIKEGTVNTAVSIPYGQGERRYDVRVKRKKTTVSKEVSVTGGEGLRLRLTKDRTKLVFEPYVPGDGGKSRTVGQFVVQVHDPTRAIEGVVDVSIRSAVAEQLSPRPKDVWIEIQPISDNESNGDESNGNVGGIRTFYDLNYRRGEPVPRLKCEDLNWPPGAGKAEVRVWFKLQETSPAATKSVGELIRGTNELSPLPGNDVEFKVRTFPMGATGGCRIEIKEVHPPNGPLHWVKVEMQTRPDVVERRFYPEAGTVRHAFVYEGANESDVAGYQVLFTPGEAIKKNALKFGESDCLEFDVGAR